MTHPIQQLEKAARVLAALPERLVFTGGATIALYLDEVAAADVRPTNDVDCVIEVGSRGSYYQIADQLRNLGLQESREEGAPLCRWQYEDLIIDIMPTDPNVLGFSNSWYEPGIPKAIPYQLPGGQSILIFPVAYLLASKIEAFQGRGNRDFYGSADFEDIVMLLDGCPGLEEQVQQADLPVQNFIRGWFRQEYHNLSIYAPAHLAPLAKQSGREQILLNRIERLVIR